MDTLDVPSCAALLHCSEAHLRRLACKGSLPAAKVGRDWVFIHEDVMNWLRERSRPRPVKVVRTRGRPRQIVYGV